MTAFTDVQLASQASKLLGGSSFTAFTDPGNEAAVMNEIYTQTYEAVLMESYWRFSMKKVTLVLNSVPDPLNQYQYKYDLPVDFLAMQTVRPQGTAWEIFGNELYSNLSHLDLDYIARPDETLLPPYFQKLLVYRLSADAAIGITDKIELNQVFERKYLQQLNVARAADSMNRPGLPLTTNPFLDAHLSGNSNKFIY